MQKRQLAARLLLAGAPFAEVAATVGVARQTASIWKSVINDGGTEALFARPMQGRPRRLSTQQVQAIAQALLHSPVEFGIEPGRWTVKRVVRLIERLHGIRYGTTQVWRILRDLRLAGQAGAYEAAFANRGAMPASLGAASACATELAMELIESTA